MQSPDGSTADTTLDPRRHRNRVGLARAGLLGVLPLVFAIFACSFQSPENLNEGRGTMDDPIPAQQFAITPDFEVRVLSIVTETQENAASDNGGYERVRVLFEVRCAEASDVICDLGEIGDHLLLVDSNGAIIRPTVYTAEENPLEGEILGTATATGWQEYELQYGLYVELALAEYGNERVFYKLPQ